MTAAVVTSSSRIHGLRKLMALVVIAGLGTWLAHYDRLTETAASFLGALYLFFAGGNVGEHFAGLKKIPFPPLPRLPRRGAPAEATAPAAPTLPPALARARDAGIDLEELIAAAASYRGGGT